jgi:rfaE bifunctional protein kinase chain/domain
VVRITEQRLTELLTNMKGKRIAVIGDLMLDRYFWGSVSRISPEAPVPVVDLETEQARLGGAANVAMNIRSLGGIPMLVGVIGADNSGKQLFEIIRENNFPTEGVVVDPSRPTTVKTRVIAHNQHVVRIDRELKTDISYTIQNNIIEVLTHNINQIDGIIIEDYNKGVVVKPLIKQLIDLANKNRKTITVDPKFNNFFEYSGVTLFKPNRKEVEEAMGMRIRTDEDIQRAGKTLREKLGCENVLLTLSEQGMALFEGNGSIASVPTRARNVQDVSGAGDTVISTLTMSLAGGANMKEAATLANFAGGIVCSYLGIVPIDVQELRTAILQHVNHQ